MEGLGLVGDRDGPPRPGSQLPCFPNPLTPQVIKNAVKTRNLPGKQDASPKNATRHMSRERLVGGVKVRIASSWRCGNVFGKREGFATIMRRNGAQPDICSLRIAHNQITIKNCRF